MSEKIQFFELHTKNKKERGGSKYVGEHWPSDNLIKNDKKEGRWSNYVRDHQPHQDRKKTVKSRGRPQNLSERI